jgi:hypothetical protein
MTLTTKMLHPANSFSFSLYLALICEISGNIDLHFASFASIAVKLLMSRRWSCSWGEFALLCPLRAILSPRISTKPHC